MSILGVVIGLCILGFGIWTAQNTKGTVSSVVDIQQEPSPTLSPTATPTPSEVPTSSPTRGITNTPTKTPPTPAPTNNSTNTTSFSISNFQYPGATVNSSSASRLELTSSDSPTSVTNWYKNKINETGMNTKSFVTTSANDNIVNKLVGANNNSEIRIDITKGPSDSSVKIIVELK